MWINHRQFSFPMRRPLGWSAAGHGIALLLVILLGIVPSPYRKRNPFTQLPPQLQVMTSAPEPLPQPPEEEPEPEDPEPEPTAVPPTPVPPTPIPPTPVPPPPKPVAEEVIHRPTPTPRHTPLPKKPQVQKKVLPTPTPAATAKPTPAPTPKIEPQVEKVKMPTPVATATPRPPRPAPTPRPTASTQQSTPNLPATQSMQAEVGVNLPDSFFSQALGLLGRQFQPQRRWLRQLEFPLVCQVELVVRRDGTILEANIERSTGNAAMDDYARQAAMAAAKLPPLSQFTDKEQIRLYVAYPYQPE